jgi:hypothetical protein
MPAQPTARYHLTLQHHRSSSSSSSSSNSNSSSSGWCFTVQTGCLTSCHCRHTYAGLLLQWTAAGDKAGAAAAPNGSETVAVADLAARLVTFSSQKLAVAVHMVAEEICLTTAATDSELPRAG